MIIREDYSNDYFTYLQSEVSDNTLGFKQTVPGALQIGQHPPSLICCSQSRSGQGFGPHRGMMFCSTVGIGVAYVDKNMKIDTIKVEQIILS